MTAHAVNGRIAHGNMAALDVQSVLTAFRKIDSLKVQVRSPVYSDQVLVQTGNIHLRILHRTDGIEVQNPGFPIQVAFSRLINFFKQVLKIEIPFGFCGIGFLSIIGLICSYYRFLSSIQLINPQALRIPQISNRTGQESVVLFDLPFCGAVCVVGILHNNRLPITVILTFLLRL